MTFYDCMTVHHNRFLANKTNRCTEFQFYWYYYSTRFRQPFCPSSVVLSHTSALVHFMQLWWTVCYQEQDGTARVYTHTHTRSRASARTHTRIYLHTKYRVQCRFSEFWLYKVLFCLSWCAVGMILSVMGTEFSSSVYLCAHTRLPDITVLPPSHFLCGSCVLCDLEVYFMHISYHKHSSML
jgi:hypothetical protein